MDVVVMVIYAFIVLLLDTFEVWGHNGTDCHKMPSFQVYLTGLPDDNNQVARSMPTGDQKYLKNIF